MTRLFSILFSILVFVHVIGYYGLFLGMAYQNDREMLEKLDAEDYDPSETILIKVPIAIPYVADASRFERVDGSFERDGEFYRLVKQRYSRDTLFLVCVKDQQRKTIEDSWVSFVKTFNGKPTERSAGFKLPILIKDYVVQAFSIRSVSLGWVNGVEKTTAVIFSISDFYPSIPHPPERG
ncbi:hypothetical protein [Chryseolinea lacunae]|uniref:Uncharacterized protein n=1 Tax=Chryseolinea lacunae TaxID=2801331 RepID=A0ABS1KN57_9BACT|nr:hypothetical protein [Chryseolinea lacunae]MBL0740768.1 hypothetical protein [Chryseolinea lacunae]